MYLYKKLLHWKYLWTLHLCISSANKKKCKEKICQLVWKLELLFFLKAGIKRREKYSKNQVNRSCRGRFMLFVELPSPSLFLPYSSNLHSHLPPHDLLLPYPCLSLIFSLLLCWIIVFTWHANLGWDDSKTSMKSTWNFYICFTQSSTMTISSPVFYWKIDMSIHKSHTRSSLHQSSLPFWVFNYTGKKNSK